MPMRASPTSPLEGRGPGGTPEEGGARVAPSGGRLQGIPNGRRVIAERCEATLLWPNGSTQDGRGAEGNKPPAKCGRAASGTPLGIALSWDSLA
jgi:hypothetical protein